MGDDNVQSATPACPPPDGGTTLRLHTPCVGCGYDLRGLPLTGHCPECGDPIHDTMLAPPLTYATPSELKHAGSGVGLLALVLAIGALMPLMVISEWDPGRPRPIISMSATGAVLVLGAAWQWLTSVLEWQRIAIAAVVEGLLVLAADVLLATGLHEGAIICLLLAFLAHGVLMLVAALHLRQTGRRADSRLLGSMLCGVMLLTALYHIGVAVLALAWGGPPRVSAGLVALSLPSTGTVILVQLPLLLLLARDIRRLRAVEPG